MIFPASTLSQLFHWPEDRAKFGPGKRSADFYTWTRLRCDWWSNLYVTIHVPLPSPRATSRSQSLRSFSGPDWSGQVPGRLPARMLPSLLSPPVRPYSADPSLVKPLSAQYIVILRSSTKTSTT